jgi:hypothetical protein
MICDICGGDYEWNSTNEFTKRIYNEYIVGGQMDVHTYFCDVCAHYVKRAKWLAEFINKQTKPMRDVVKKTEQLITSRVDDFRYDCMHHIETEFAKIRTDINRVLLQLDEKLQSIQVMNNE